MQQSMSKSRFTWPTLGPHHLRTTCMLRTCTFAICRGTSPSEGERGEEGLTPLLYVFRSLWVLVESLVNLVRTSLGCLVRRSLKWACCHYPVQCLHRCRRLRHRTSMIVSHCYSRVHSTRATAPSPVLACLTWTTTAATATLVAGVRLMRRMSRGCRKTIWKKVGTGTIYRLV